ncbi:MAG: hypothetical protein RLZZ461_1667 [Planctomycetota bacterium]
MTAPLIHLGLHRTGSTWFQTRVLDGLDGRAVNAVADRRESTERIVLPRDREFDADAVRSWLADRFAAAAASGSPPILSNERFSGNPAAGWHDAERTARRLAEVVPGARVLLVVREPHDWLRSIWLQQVRIGHPAGIEDFLRTPAPGDHRLPTPDLDFLRIDRFVDDLDAIFGRDRVLVLPYELLRRDARNFLDRVSTFAGFKIPEPVSNDPVFAAPPLLEAAVLRRVNLLSVRSSLHRAPPLPRLEPAGRRLAHLIGRCATTFGERRRRARVEAIIARRLAPLDLPTSNRRLADRIGVDLTELGWPC